MYARGTHAISEGMRTLPIPVGVMGMMYPVFFFKYWFAAGTGTCGNFKCPIFSKVPAFCLVPCFCLRSYLVWSLSLSRCWFDAVYAVLVSSSSSSSAGVRWLQGGRVELRGSAVHHVDAEPAVR